MTLETATDRLIGPHCSSGYENPPTKLFPVRGPLQILMGVENQQGAEQGATGMSSCSFIHSFIPPGCTEQLAASLRNLARQGTQFPGLCAKEKLECSLAHTFLRLSRWTLPTLPSTWHLVLLVKSHQSVAGGPGRTASPELFRPKPQLLSCNPETSHRTENPMFS